MAFLELWRDSRVSTREVFGRPACPGVRPPRRSSARAQSACPTALAPRLTPHGVLSLGGRAFALLGSFCFLLPVMAELMLTQAHTRTRGMRSDERPPGEAATHLRAPGARGACGWDSQVPRGFAAATHGQRPLRPRPPGSCPSPDAPVKGPPADGALSLPGGAGRARSAEPAGKCNSATSRPIQQSHCWAYTLRKPEGKETRVPQCSSQHCL